MMTAFFVAISLQSTSPEFHHIHTHTKENKKDREIITENNISFESNNNGVAMCVCLCVYSN